MDSGIHEIAERRINHALPFHTTPARECRAFDVQREMAFAFRVVAAVAAMLLAVVDELNPAGRKRRVEPAEHFSRNWSSSLVAHDSYIKAFNGFETGKDAWTG